MKEDAVQARAARQKVAAAASLMERARDLLKAAGPALDPSGKVERERDLDFEIDVAPDPAGAVAFCVLEDHLEPATAELRRVVPAEPEESGVPAGEEAA